MPPFSLHQWLEGLGMACIIGAIIGRYANRGSLSTRRATLLASLAGALLLFSDNLVTRNFVFAVIWALFAAVGLAELVGKFRRPGP